MMCLNILLDLSSVNVLWVSLWWVNQRKLHGLGIYYYSFLTRPRRGGGLHPPAGPIPHEARHRTRAQGLGAGGGSLQPAAHAGAWVPLGPAAVGDGNIPPRPPPQWLSHPRISPKFPLASPIHWAPAVCRVRCLMVWSRGWGIWGCFRKEQRDVDSHHVSLRIINSTRFNPNFYSLSRYCSFEVANIQYFKLYVGNDASVSRQVIGVNGTTPAWTCLFLVEMEKLISDRWKTSWYRYDNL